MKTEEEIAKLSSVIINGDLLREPVELSLADFRRLYDFIIIQNNRVIPDTVIINLGDQAFVLFPKWSRQEIAIAQKSHLTAKDFDFVSNPDWRGPKNKLPSFSKFIIDEFLTHKLRSTFIFVTSLALFIAIGPEEEALKTISSVLIQTSTVFLSIYLIFTVSQTERLSLDRKLFNRGILQKYYSDDKNITLFALSTVFVILLGSMLIYLPLIRSTLSAPLLESPGKLITAFWGTLAMSMQVHTFLVVADYYLERTRDLAEREHLGQILHEEYRKRNPEK